MSVAITSINPFDGSVVGVTEPITAEELELMLERARRAAGTWARTGLDERAAPLRRLSALLERDGGELAALIVAETGKRIAEAVGEVGWAALTARWYADHPPTEERVAGARVRTVPLGVIAAITPWNVPLVTPLWKLCPALMAGNAVIWKPSELSTLVARATTRLFLEAGIPDSVLQLAAGNGAVGAALVADPRVDGVHFTGSDGTGRSIAKTTGARLGRAALELGGSSPAIVLDDADVDAAADAIVAAATAVNGQKCTATRRVVATPGAAPAVAAAIARRLAALRPGDPASADTTLGPLVTVDAAARASAELERWLASGTQLLGRSPGGGGQAAFRAALVSGLPAGDPARRRELFAPVLLLEHARDEQAAVRLANATTFGLVASVHSADPERARAVAARLESGIVAINRRTDDVALEAPFGGLKASGNGVPEGGQYAYRGVGALQTIYETP